MMESEKKLYILFGLFMGLVFFGLGTKMGYEKCKGSFVEPQCDTIIKHDTINVKPSDNPTIKDSVVGENLKSIPITVHDTCWVHDTCYVYVNIGHHHTNVPGVADIWYSGFQAKIDSVRFYQQTTSITNTVFQTEYKIPRLTLAVGGGGFYCGERITPYLIGKIAYNAPKTTITVFGAIEHTGQWGVGAELTYRFTLIE